MFKPWVILQFFVMADYFQQIATKLYCCIFTSLLKPSPRPLWSSSRLCHSLISSKWGNKELNPCLQVYASHLYCEKERWWFWYFARTQRNVMQIEICFEHIWINCFQSCWDSFCFSTLDFDRGHFQITVIPTITIFSSIWGWSLTKRFFLKVSWLICWQSNENILEHK